MGRRDTTQVSCALRSEGQLWLTWISFVSVLHIEPFCLVWKFLTIFVCYTKLMVCSQWFDTSIPIHFEETGESELYFLTLWEKYIKPELLPMWFSCFSTKCLAAVVVTDKFCERKEGWTPCMHTLLSLGVLCSVPAGTTVQAQASLCQPSSPWMGWSFNSSFKTKQNPASKTGQSS